jgi:predicted phosphohydrolase
MTRIVVISDTHGLHLGVPVPDGDILIHCGDFCNRGTYQDAVRFINWFQTHPHKHKIFIAGNHDLVLDQGSLNDINVLTRIMTNTNTHYLNDDGVRICGLNFWGSPVQPRFFNWAFNRDRGEDIKKHWDKIPIGTDVLINAVKKIQPKLHVFGHIHYPGGQVSAIPNLHTTFANAALVDENYVVCRKPLAFDVDVDAKSLTPVWLE